MIQAATIAPATGARAPDGLSFLEAQRVLASFPGGPAVPFLFGMAGTAEPFRVYLDAAFARHHRRAAPTFLSYGTLGQFLNGGIAPGGPEVFLLFPWDLAPELDWRSGVPRQRVDAPGVVARAEAFVAALTRRGAHLLYVSAPTPPVAGHPATDASLRLRLDAIAAEACATTLPQAAFSLGGYFTSGCPVSAAWLGRVATQVADAILAPARVPAKVLVTDLDNTLWNGVLAEVGVENISYAPAGAGFRHHVYQSLLARMRREGVLLAAVTRNDPDTVASALASDAMAVGAADFVSVCASYQAKSAQVRELAQRLNIGLDAFVFVDDNPVELEEVRASLPEVRVLPFPVRDDALPDFLNTLADAFGRLDVTEEDRARTELYQRRAKGMAPASAAGADLTNFLASLSMQLQLRDRSRGDRTRAVQLINKTNQFNANGRRWTDEDVATLLEQGGRLVTATLDDRTGSHGEIAACLMDASGVIEAFVMSCRVFQRRVEHAFVTTLATQEHPPAALRHVVTPRNEPFRQFMNDDAFQRTAADLFAFDADRWTACHQADVALFDVRWE